MLLGRLLSEFLFCCGGSVDTHTKSEQIKIQLIPLNLSLDEHLSAEQSTH